MKLIVGLGNPGKEYYNTRHNVGFSFLDSYLEYLKLDVNWSEKFEGLCFQTNVMGEKVIFLKPSTYMNLSGNSVRKCMDYYHIAIDDLLVISDDLDLLLGNYKLKLSGSSGGHNGLKSIESCLGSFSYKRLKIGISNNKELDTKDYVLGSFSNKDKDVLLSLFRELFPVMDDYFKLDFSSLMNKYNHKNR